MLTERWVNFSLDWSRLTDRKINWLFDWVINWLIDCVIVWLTLWETLLVTGWLRASINEFWLTRWIFIWWLVERLTESLTWQESDWVDHYLTYCTRSTVAHWLTYWQRDRQREERHTVSLSDWQTYVWPTDKLIDHYFYFKIQQYARNIDELKSQLGVSQDKLHKQVQEASRRDEQLVVLKVELATLQEKHRLVQDEVLQKTSLEIPVWK